MNVENAQKHESHQKKFNEMNKQYACLLTSKHNVVFI
jgi:hypothetical protein